jgi:hypothetical protein
MIKWFIVAIGILIDIAILVGAVYGLIMLIHDIF